MTTTPATVDPRPAPTDWPENLHPALLADGWCVSDDEGGVWWPDDKAQAEIAAAPDPKRVAVAMVQTSPMRGNWKA